MRDISLPAPVSAGSTTTATAQGVPGVIGDPPPAVARLDNGTILRGEVIGRDRQGQLLVRTDAGVLPIATKAKLPVGSQVTIQIRSAGSELHIAILNVEAGDPSHRGVPRGEPPPPAPANPRAGAAAAPQDQVRISGGLAGAKGVPGTVSNAPPSVSRLVSGASLPAQVLGQDHGGQLLVRTELGTLRIATEAAPPKNATIVLQVRSVVPQLNVVITPADAAGGPVPTQAPAHTAGAPGATTAGTTTGTGTLLQGGPGHATPAADVLTVGQRVIAQVVAGPATQTAGQTVGQPQAATPGAITPGAITPGLVTPGPGGEVQLQIIRVETPAGAATTPASQAPAALATATAGGAQVPVGSTAVTPPTAPLVPGSTPLAAEAATASATGAGQGPAMTATVVGTTPAGKPLVDTPLGRLALGIQAQLPPGTRLVAEIVPGVTGPGPMPGAAAKESVSLAYAWPALDEAVESLTRSDPAIAQAVLSGDGQGTSLPQPGPRLASSILFFLSALTGGDPGGWLSRLAGGQAARALEQAGQGELLGRLMSDLGQLGRYADAGGDWRLFALPFFDGHQLHQLRLFLRHGRHRGQGDDDAEEATRFVLEVELSRMGELQLDGLVRQKRFDLNLRSRQALDPRMRADIAAIYQNANEATGYSGQISFQASNDWPPMPVETDAKDLAGLVV